MRRFGICSAVLVLACVAVVTAATKKYVNSTYGFSTELPDTWVSLSQKTATGTALVFSGPQGTDEFYTTVNLQVVIRKLSDTLDARADELEQQFATAPQFSRLSRTRFVLAGQPAIRLVVTYQQPGGTERFKQDQVIAERGDYYYMLGYTAPADLFDRAAPVMAQVISSFQFLPVK